MNLLGTDEHGNTWKTEIGGGAPSDVEQVVMPEPSAGREEQAVRWALNHFEEWHNVTDTPPAHSGYYYEVLSLIEDAAKIGFGAAHGQTLDRIKNRLKA